ncbi:MAG: 50S ribosomal protein L7/L12 [Candidatus Tyloplasma litorale]|nr:MAG: 50S ribosomal protein L7/L12 [Mycoplasmatales bacterium]
MAIKIEDFIKELKEMKVSELNELVKAIEEEFGVTAAAPMAAAASDEEAAGPTEVNVELVSAGGNKIAVIKVIREVMGLALMDAKKVADNGGVIKEGLSPEEAEELMEKFKAAGAEVVAK